MAKKGWRRESKRHSLARLGVKTTHKRLSSSKMNAKSRDFSSVLRTRASLKEFWEDPSTTRQDKIAALESAGIVKRSAKRYSKMTYSQLDHNTDDLITEIVLERADSQASFGGDRAVW